MKDYYKVLGVHRLASSGEIKIAYRKLAIQYHPDRNQQPEAEYKIKEINEAYHVLGDKVRKWEYDQKRFKPVAADQSVTFYQPRAASPKFQHPFPSQTAHAPHVNGKAAHGIGEILTGYLPLAYKVSLVSLLFCLFLLLDYALPFSESTEKIVRKDMLYGVQGLAQRRFHILVTEANRRFRLATDDADLFQVGAHATVVSSRLIGVPICIRSAAAGQKDFYATIYRNFLFIPLILLITSVLGIRHKGNVERRFTHGVVNMFVLTLGLFFLFYHKLFL